MPVSCEPLSNWCKQTCTVQNARGKLPITIWLPRYRLKDLQGDIIAGLTVGLTVIPQGLAYAQIANLPHQYGLYSAFMGCFVYCLLGTSKDITLGPTAIMSLLTTAFATTHVVDPPLYAIVLTFITGLVQLTMGIFQLGILVDFISFPVISGFTSAAAITIAFGQIKHLLGVKTEGGANFIESVISLFSNIGKTNVWDFTMGCSCGILLICLKQFKSIDWGDEDENEITVLQKVARKFLWLFGTARNAVIVIAASLIAATLLTQNIDVLSLTGKLKEGLPPFQVPQFSKQIGNTTITSSDIFSKIGVGLGIVPLMGLVETIAIGKAFARENNYRIEPNQELLAIGCSNILGSFIGSYPVTGSFSRTAVNSQSGVRSPLGGVFTGCLVLLALGVLTPLFFYIPAAALAAVIIMAVLPMVDCKVPLKLWKINKWDLLPYISTFLLSFVIGIEYGILVGIGVSLLIILYPSARPKIWSVHREVVVIQLEQGLSFPGVEYMKQRIIDEAIAAGIPQSVIVDCSYISQTDFSTVQGFEQLIEDFKRRNVCLMFSNMQASTLEMVRRAEIEGFEYFGSVEQACKAAHESNNLNLNNDELRQPLLPDSSDAIVTT